MQETVGKNNKSLKKNSIYYLIYNALNVLFPFVTGIYAARVLLASDIGAVETARNFSSYFVIFAFLGIPTYGLREIAKCKQNGEEMSKVFSELVIINVISSVTFSAIYYAIILSVPFYRENLILYSITGLAIILNSLNVSWLYEGIEEFRYISIRNLLFKVVSVILLFLLVRKPGDYLWYASITVIGIAGNYLLNVFRSRRIVSFSFKGINLRRHLRPVIVLTLVNLAIEVYSLVDVTMLGFLSEKEEVAYYSYAMKIQKILLQIINTFTIVGVPRLTKSYNDGDLERFNAILTKTVKVIFLLVLPMIVGVFFVGDYLICLLYGNDYITSSNILKILCVILLFSPVGYLLGSRILLICKKENYMIIPVSIGAVVNIILNAILIPLYDGVGAAIASLSSEIVVMAVYLFLSRRKYTLYGLFKFAIKELIALAVCVSFLLGMAFLPIDKALITIFQISGTIILYFSMLLILKEETTLNAFGFVLGVFKRTKKGNS